MKNKPSRRCVGCFQDFPQEDLVRVVKTPKGQVQVCAPESSKIPGRGAYVCKKMNCIKTALKSKGRKRSPLHFWLGQPLPDNTQKKLLDLVE